MSLIMIMSPLIITFSIMFTRLIHPLAMGLMLLLQTMMICVTAGLSMNSFWFSYILFLIFLGGMLVLFMYVASLASNETFSFSSLLVMITGSVMFVSVVIALLDPMLLNHPIHLAQSSIMTELTNSTPVLLSTIYNKTTTNLTLFIVLYLLLTLIAVVKITNTFFGPLRLSS
uniref:NADH-ubiquinone oxidoreductase chain 6 n=1 Tax=Metapenaeus ensis TaxID=32278 RepID=A0A0D5YAL1_METEN|nr:NADH dehydrogenase subunit 6 [Metapenaeus ensis]AKA27973.1 NADH dehydrogenase subunit 6 [Metapenaeus ensis]QID77074.1 NADH dehydrogenase subunit 6 [Metapenaeus ensis]UUF68265.1 NADH dehydrogenase subunit 6 [Metapenaeus ensis]